MAWVPAVCPQCGGKIEVDDSKEKGICSFCGTEFNAEKAINNYNYKIKNDYHFANAEVHIFDEKSTENKLKNAEVFFLKHKDFGKARKLFLEVTNESPDDYRGWWGVARVDTKEFTEICCDKYTLNQIVYFVSRAFNVAGDKKDSLKAKYMEYVAKVQRSLNDKINNVNIEDEKLNAQINEINEQLVPCRRTSTEIQNQINSINSKRSFEFDGFTMSCAIVTFLISAAVTAAGSSCLFSNGAWDSSTWIVGGPTLVAAIVAIISLLVIIVFIILNYLSSSRKKRYKNLIHQEDFVNQKITNLQHSKEKLENKINDLNTRRVRYEKLIRKIQNKE